MKLIKFTDGSSGVPVWINSDAVASVQSDADLNSKMTVITTQDGKEHRVQGLLAAIVATLQQGF